MSDAALHALVRMLQAHTPLERLSNMEARTVFDFMEQRGFVITKTETSHYQLTETEGTKNHG
jgi:hypothetical protein